MMTLKIKLIAVARMLITIYIARREDGRAERRRVHETQLKLAESGVQWTRIDQIG